MAISGQQRRCALVIQSSQVASALTDFPLYLNEDTLPAEMLNTSSSYPAQADGGDIRFSSDSAGTTELAFEIVDFTPTAGGVGATAQIWVKVPSISASSDTTIYVWYNTSGTTTGYSATDTYGRNAVWTDYAAVWHMDAASTVDSTGNGHSITWTGSPGTRSGPLNLTAVDLDGSSQYGTVADNAAFELLVSSSQNTLSAWAISDVEYSGFGSGTVAAKKDEWGCDLYNNNVTNSALFPRCYTYGDNNVGGGSVSDSVSAAAWTLIHWQLNAGTSIAVYVDGALDGSVDSITDTSSGTANAMTFGQNNTANYLNGGLAEVRIRTAIDASTIASSEYNNQSNPGTFVIEGTPASTGGGGISIPLVVHHLNQMRQR